jgi:hypothetical protein
VADGDAGDEPRRNSDERPERGARTPDATLLALDNLVEAAQQITRMTEHVTARAAYIRACRLQGRAYRDIVSGGDAPLIAGLLTENIRRLEAASTRFRQAEAAALHQEGMTMEEIGRLFGLTRQRISAMIRSAAVAPPSPTGDHDTPPRPTTGARDDLGKSDS